MKKIFFLSILLSAAFLQAVECDACTSAIFTGKSTPDGRPLLWKHRDTGELDNRIEFFPSGKGRRYGFIGLVNSDSQDGEVWTGTNETGFSIMNTASYNLQSEKAQIEDQEVYNGGDQHLPGVECPKARRKIRIDHRSHDVRTAALPETAQQCVLQRRCRGIPL